MRRLVPLTAVLALVALSCGGSAEDTSITTAPGTQGGVTTASAAAGGTEVAAATGGTVTSDDGNLVVNIPAGALTDDIAISITRLDPEDWPEGFADGAVVGEVYDLQPGGLTFSDPVTISHRITEADTGLDFDVEVPLTLLVVVSDDGTWEAPADQVITRDGEDLLHTGVIDHFSVTTMFGGLVTVTFTPTAVEARVGEAFKASVDAIVVDGQGYIEAGLLFAAPIASGAVAALPSREFETDSPEEEEGFSAEYRCVTVGEGRYGMLITVGETDTELFGSPAETLFYLQFGNLVQPTVSTDVLTGTALCRDGGSAPSAGDELTIPGDFIPTAESSSFCGDFSDMVEVIFETGTTGTIDWVGLEGIPFTMTGDILVGEEFKSVPEAPGVSTRDLFMINFTTGEITVANEVIPAEAGLSCRYTATVPLDQLVAQPSPDPASPSAGDTITIPADFTATEESSTFCGGFSNSVVVEFGVIGTVTGTLDLDVDGNGNITGTVVFHGEPEGRPLTTTDNVLVADVEIDDPTYVGYVVVHEVFTINFATGDISLLFEVTPPEAGLTCGYNGSVDPDQLAPLLSPNE